MLFNLFGKKDIDAGDHVFIDRAYMNSAAKFNAVVNLAKNEPKTIFICWFDDTLKKIKTLFKEQGIDERRLMIAGRLNRQSLEDSSPVFTEHYPLHARELELINDLQVDKFIVFSAMDEPLFRHFGSEKIIPLMKMMGMKEDEVIEHSMVSKSIRSGQEKIAAQVSTEYAAASQEEWLKKHVA